MMWVRPFFASNLLISLTAFGAGPELVQGSWFRPCWDGPLGLRTQELMKYEGNHVTVNRLMTVQDTCGAFDIEFEGEADITSYKKPVEGLEDTYEVDAVWRRIRVRPLTTTAANDFNSDKLKMCGLTNWKAGEWNEQVEGKICKDLKVPSIGSTYHQIYKIVGERNTTEDQERNNPEEIYNGYSRKVSDEPDFKPTFVVSKGRGIIFGDVEKKNRDGEKLNGAEERLRPTELEIPSLHFQGRPTKEERPIKPPAKPKVRKRQVVGE